MTKHWKREEESRSERAITNKNGAAPEQLEPTYRADGEAMQVG